MNDFNSRYRNIDDQPDTIRTNAGGYGGNFAGGNYGDGGFGGGSYGDGGFGGGFDDGFGNDMDIMEAKNAQKKKQVARASQARSGGSARARKNKRNMLIYGIIILVEIIALVVIWINYISYAKKAKGGSSSKAKTESSEDSSSSGNINVDNESFALTCTKISITNDADGNPAALVYFTFVNKTDSPLSMSQVFAPSFKQNGTDLSTFAALAEEPQEIYNKDSQVSGGQSVECAYAVTLQDTTSEITITMHDNYETFSDIGSTVVPIS